MAERIYLSGRLSFVVFAIFSGFSASNVHRFAQSAQHHAPIQSDAPVGAGPMKLSLNTQSGDYRLFVGASPWLQSAPTFFTNKWEQHNSAPGGGLNFVGSYTDSGTDNLGTWTSTIFRYNPANQPDLEIRTEFKVYTDFPEMVLFGQHFPMGINGSSLGPKSEISSGFPSFIIDDSQLGSAVGYLAYGGIMFGDTGKTIGVWNGTDARRIMGGMDSGPLVLFNSLGDTIVLSPFTNFMAVSTDYSVRDGRMTASWGVLGSATHIPVDYSIWTIASYSSMGINEGMRRWGEVLRFFYRRGTEYRDSDITNHYIGYYTDNGAYYYYLTETGKTYEKTLIDVKEYSGYVNIPYRYIQYDSWFYPKDNKTYAGGVMEWVSMPSVFPNGMQYVWNQTGWISVAHNRWWSDKTVYAEQNGGKYKFIVERETEKALPVDPEFWSDLFSESRKWGLVVYEQDWLNWQFDNMNATVSSVTLGREWLRQMGEGARKNGINIQYCMAPSRHALTSLEIPNVVQARVSTDYQPGNDQWKIGISSMFAHAIGVAPFKDNFWTTKTQPGNIYHKTEPYPELQSLVATLSMGPVAPSDMIGHSNHTLIMRSCNEDGLILKPSKPATAVDDQLYLKAFNNFSGEVWTTYSNISGWIFGIIFAADFKSTDKFVLTPTAAGFGSQFPASFVFSWFSPSAANAFSDSAPLVLVDCYKDPFCLYLTTPSFTVGNNEIELGGELDKWVPMSPRRIAEIKVTSSELEVYFVGAAAESVNFFYALNGVVGNTKCILSEDGRAVLFVSVGKCETY